MTCKSGMYIDHIEQQLEEIKAHVASLEAVVRAMEQRTALSNERIKQWSQTLQLIGTVVLTTALNWLLKWFTRGG